MRYIYRGTTIFEYIKEEKNVKLHTVGGRMSAWDYCRLIPEDYKLLGVFFDKVYRHINGEEVELNDIVVN